MDPAQPVAHSTHLLTCVPPTLNPKPEYPQAAFQLSQCADCRPHQHTPDLRHIGHSVPSPESSQNSMPAHMSMCKCTRTCCFSFPVPCNSHSQNKSSARTIHTHNAHDVLSLLKPLSMSVLPLPHHPLPAHGAHLFTTYDCPLTSNILAHAYRYLCTHEHILIVSNTPKLVYTLKGMHT